MKDIAVLLAGDHNMVRQSLCFLLEAQSDIGIVGEAETGRQAVQMAKTLQPDVVVMDILMPDSDGLEATRQIRKEMPHAKVLVLSSHGDEAEMDQFTEAGASGYLLKQSPAVDLIKAVREAFKGNMFFGPTFSNRLVSTCVDSRPRKLLLVKRNDSLTARESEVLQLIAKGKINKEIASDLCISVKTVEKHRQQVMDKLNIHDIAGLTRYAIAHGMIELIVASHF